MARTVGFNHLESGYRRWVMSNRTTRQNDYYENVVHYDRPWAFVGMIRAVLEPLAITRIIVVSLCQRDNNDTRWDFMLKGFMRTMGAGTSLAKQKVALASAGLDVADEFGSVYVDDREAAISSLMEGDVLAVTTAACLGHPEHDILAALAEVGKRGATVLDLETNEEVAIHPDAERAMAFAIRGGTSTRHAVAAKARKARAASGNLGGKQPVRWDRKKLNQVEEMLANGMPRQEMADKLGISRATLQRKLREMTSRKGATSEREP